ncbi:hypothetical protein ATE84_2080 [Aquimarina sp. MAR_2010_214]|uniref:hypothetical protein n=1 Tax=Aquimarina sp. MAR_2010_214 TaxID=1250026 RepID=UPI000C700CC2|nr:hypothetical protein [Aquimarina sp. MAR_2010_214]PKV50034.1 hypothetical protein ATE84_2080 [Aquimarina sp. MAR_2010_214]
MIVSHKVESYSLQIVSNYAGGGGYQMGFVYLYGQNQEYVGHLAIIKDGKTLPENRQHNNGTLTVYFHETDLQSILETLRNESPVSIKLNTSSKWGSIETGKETVGNGELAA